VPGPTATVEGAEVLLLRLYVAGDGPNSVEARANLAAILHDHPEARYQLEVVDFLKEPLRAMRDGVIVTPTLVRLAPPPERKLIGTLRETATVCAALGFAEVQGG
jgi:circadian clock protein KaiB